MARKPKFPFFLSLFLHLACMMALFGCPREEPPLQEPQKPATTPAFERISQVDLPDFGDDLDKASLRTAVEQSLSFYSRTPADRTYALGEMQVSAGMLEKSLRAFLELLDSGHIDSDSIFRVFDVYMARTDGPDSKPLVTGYYEPILEARLQPDSSFRYPLYSMPPDLVTVDLAAFDPQRFSGERLVGRLKDGRVVPYHTRGEIDGKAALERSQCQIAWLADPVEAFFLHIQGSGMLQLPDGKTRRIGYAGGNGRPYRSVGKYLIDKGVMASADVTAQSIKAYLRANPNIRDEALWSNESYIFFRWIEEGPVGSLNVRLTSGRSIATDVRYHPRGALAFLETEKPRLDSNGQVTGWEALRRWVLNQDTGGAIKGIGRVDLFCGSGEAAEWIAGRLKHPGKLYFLIKKGEAGT